MTPFRGKAKWKVLSMFSGIECFREAMLMIQSAVAERFGVDLDHGYELMALW